MTRQSAVFLIVASLLPLGWWLDAGRWAEVLAWLMLLVTGLWRFRALADRDTPSAETEQRDEAAPAAAELHAVLHEAGASAGQEIELIRSELQQIQDVFRDAVEQLNQSFNGLYRNTTEQKNIIDELMDSLVNPMQDDPAAGAGEGNSIQRFVAETSRTLRYFIDLVVEISRESVETVHYIDDMSEQMEGIVALVDDVKAIADQTNLLALNAAIEAARAGEAGRGFAVVADEVRKLSQNSAQFNEQIRDQVEVTKQSVDRARKIVGEMAAQDMNVAIQAKGRVDDMMEGLEEMNRRVAESLERLSGVSGSIDRDVAVAVRSLQFEDIARQLVEHVQGRLEQLDNLDRALLGAMSLLEEKTDTAASEALATLRGALDGMRQRMNREQFRVAHQQNVEEGDVELF